MGIFSNGENYRVSYYLADKKFQTTDIKEYDKKESLRSFLEKENYSPSDVERIMTSNNPFDTAFSELRNPSSKYLSDEYNRFKKIVIINTIEGLENNEQKYSTLSSITIYFTYLICLRFGILTIGERKTDMSEKKQFIKELSTNNDRALMWFDDKVATCIAIYINKFNLTLPEFANELIEEYKNNKGIPKSIIGTDDEFMVITFKLLELLTQKKKYRISNIFK